MNELFPKVSNKITQSTYNFCFCNPKSLTSQCMGYKCISRPGLFLRNIFKWKLIHLYTQRQKTIQNASLIFFSKSSLLILTIHLHENSDSLHGQPSERRICVGATELQTSQDGSDLLLSPSSNPLTTTTLYHNLSKYTKTSPLATQILEP